MIGVEYLVTLNLFPHGVNSFLPLPSLRFFFHAETT